MTKLFLHSFIILALFSSGCTTETQKREPMPSQANNATPPKTEGIWIDVREPEEFAQGHLQSALNITSRELANKIISIAPDKDTTINLYCRSGSRAETAHKILNDMGYTHVINHGGYQALYDKGYR